MQVRKLVLSALLCSLMLTASAYAAEKTLRSDVSRPLQSAQELIKDKKNKDALAKVAQTDAIAEKTDYEIEMIERIRGTAAMNLNDVELANKSFNTLMNVASIPAADKAAIAETMIGFHFRNKTYVDAATWVNRYFEAGGNKENIRVMLPQALYLSEQYDKAGAAMLALVEADVKAGKTPDKNNLEILASSYANSKNENGYASALEKMVTYYPAKEYWEDLLPRIINKSTFEDRLRIDGYRLQVATDTMSDEDYYYMAEEAVRQGYAIHAKKILEQGKAAGLIGVGKFAAEHNKLIASVAKEAAEDEKALPQNEAQGLKSPDGSRIFRAGYNYVALGQAEKGLALMEQGLTKGKLKNTAEAQLRLGVAYLQNGNKQRATELLQQIKATDGSADLARLWLLKAKSS